MSAHMPSEPAAEPLALYQHELELARDALAAMREAEDRITLLLCRLEAWEAAERQ